VRAALQIADHDPDEAPCVRSEAFAGNVIGLAGGSSARAP
jgi:hypothetical protein